MVKTQIELPEEKIEALSLSYKITELALFCSFWRKEFRPDSNSYISVNFAPDVQWSGLDCV
ncbi:hypothetical protein [Laspinema olomoucense]|uniref:hypothetical protein n=1 Tax=Laspinema olomoucense TaxID=3231600 RepID=UPI0021BB0696|nr:hypothetical protein [Laspinema sp. D3d]MCT7972312.1 hypothetical protein [Laspinema sp. D3d]